MNRWKTCALLLALSLPIALSAQVEWPNSFTPNGDKRNDVFRPAHTPLDQIVEIAVYNRWGLPVVKVKEMGWEGIMTNGKPAPAGTYYYLAILINATGERKTHSGQVTLIR